MFKNGIYYIQLLWYFGNLAHIPCNHAIDLRILGRVVRELEKKGLYQDYLDLFLQQEKDGIIEKIFVPPRRFEDYVWIPQRHIFKSGSAATTSIRSVSTFRMKKGISVSLNEATYSTVNLSGDMLE